MRNIKNMWVRLVLGILLVSVFLILTFSALPSYIATYGATENEIKGTYPGDEIISSPAVMWTHGLSISAPPEQVWPWIVQIGQSRGGFYSYTFIENMISRDGSYRNASQVIAEFQNPKPGDYIITDMLPIKEFKTGEYFLAAVDDFFGMKWTWGWNLKPEGKENTRLVIRMKIESKDADKNPAALLFINAGGFIMEKAMLRGIQDRSEGRPFPAPIEPLEMLFWFATLAAGIASAWLVIRRTNWLYPLALGLTSVAALLVFTFVQPSDILQLVIILILGMALWRLVKRDKNLREKEQK